jgi:protein-S-isoprenylcysteine O-methyltransferase Ste14
MRFKQSHFIDLHKGVTFLAILGLMAAYGRWQSPTAWVYLALHGTYGLLWVLKGRVFPDRQWQQATSVGYGLAIWGALSLYWLAPWILCVRGIEAPPWLLGLSIALYALGVFLHFASDMQKHTALKVQPGLITDGLFSRIRNPNYLGELLIYAGFGMLALHWLPFVVIGLYIVAVWLPNMRRKDRSLSRYPGFDAYKRRTKLLIPFVW